MAHFGFGSSTDRSNHASVWFLGLLLLGLSDFSLAQAPPPGSGPIDLAAAAPISFGVPIWSLRVADLDADGFDDLIGTSLSTQEVLARFSDGNGDFNPVVTLASGVRTFDVRFAHIDQDLTLDMVVRNTQPNEIVVYLGDGSGGFTLGSTIPTGSVSGDFVLADIDNLGTLDIAFVDAGTVGGRGALVAYQGDGLGGFTQNTAVQTLGFRPTAIGAVDLDQDGKLEIIVSDLIADHLEIFSGDFAIGLTNTGTISVPSAPASIHVARLDQDLLADVVVACRTAGTNVLAFRNTGSGALAPLAQLSTGSLAEQVAVRDLNGDLMTDIAASNRQAGTVSTFIQGPSSTFTSPLAYYAGGENVSVDFIDANLDGTIDCVASGSDRGDGISLLVGTGDGRLIAKRSFELPAPPGAVVAIDWNSDGLDDLLVADRIAASAKIYPSRPDGSLSPPLAIAAPYWTEKILVARWDNTPPMDIFWMTNQGLFVTAGFSNGSYQQFTNPISLSARGDFAVVDLDGDGHSEIITMGFCAQYPACPSSSMGLYVQNRFATGQAFINQPLGAGQSYTPTAFAVADIDGDGSLDIVWAGRGTSSTQTRLIGALLGNGTGGFSLGPIDNGPIGSADLLQLADISGDGVLDAVLASSGSPQIAVALGDGAGGFYSSTVTTLQDNIASLSVADFNRDGSADIAITTSSGAAPVVLIETDGMGNYTTTEHYVPGIESLATIGDFNGDHAADLAVVSSNPPGAFILDNLGNALRVRTLARETPFGNSDITITNFGLTPGREYFAIFDTSPCLGLPGSGPSSTLGLCIGSASALQSVVQQLSTPAGVGPFHFVATDTAMTFGPYYFLPSSSIAVDGVLFSVQAGAISKRSLVERLVIP